MIAAAIDLFTVGHLSAGLILGTGLASPGDQTWLAAPGAVGAWLYALLGYRSLVFSLGQWALGIERCRYQEIAEYAGAGSLFLVADVPHAARARRVIGVLAAQTGAVMLAR